MYTYSTRFSAGGLEARFTRPSDHQATSAPLDFAPARSLSTLDSNTSFVDPNIDPRLQQQPQLSEDGRGARRERATPSFSPPIGDLGLVARRSSIIPPAACAFSPPTGLFAQRSSIPPAASSPHPSDRQPSSAPLDSLAAVSSTVGDAFKFVSQVLMVFGRNLLKFIYSSRLAAGGPKAWPSDYQPPVSALPNFASALSLSPLADSDVTSTVRVGDVFVPSTYSV
jgi:hypothetical protein